MAGSAVRVDPQVVEFKDVKVGHVYKTTVTATNVGKTLKKIIIEKPKLKLFKLWADSLGQALAPGLSVSSLLEFTPEDEEEVRDYLIIRVDDAETIKIPLLGFPRACLLQVDSVLDFGCIVASSQVVTKYHPITNQGAAPGMFQVQYRGDSTVQVSPCSGIIAAGTTQWLKVEVHTDMPRQIEETALIKLQNCSVASLSIRAEVVDQHLEIFDMQGAQLSCLWFGPVYFGTFRIEHVILRNNAPRASDWVAVLQDNAAGTELGTDLQKSTDTTLLERMEKCSPTTQDVSQVLVCVPNQGRLGPYDQTTVTIRFSPVNTGKHGKKNRGHSASRQDYCVFLLFESVESRHGFTCPTGNSSVELAVTGSGLPVSLVPSPSRRFDFLTCVMGQSVDVLCVLQNLCSQLPVHFKFRKIANFTTKPSTGFIRPGQCQDVVLSFTAQQQGSFHVRLFLDVLGHVVDESRDNVDVTEIRSFCTITLHLSAVCRSETKKPVPNLNSGITPAVTNPSGSWPYVLCSDLAHCCEVAHAAILCANKTQLHAHHRERGQNAEKEEFLALPNNRASSIRPASSPTQYRTIFTGVPRHRYVDTSYAFTEEEEEQRQRHRQIYTDFIKCLRQRRLSWIKEKKQNQVEEDVDIGIIPSQGIVPPELSVSDADNIKGTEAIPEHQYLSSGNKCSCPQDMTSIAKQITRQVSGEINAVPTSDREVADCSRTLTAQELFKVFIGPVLVDFGEVCVQSVCIQTLELMNHLSVYVWVQLEVDCPELQGSSPLSHVLPPCSHTTLPLTFQSNKSGHFYRPVSYSINQHHPGQVLVQAQVVPLALELSTTRLVLSPTPILCPQSEYRTSVTLRNQRNHAAEFTWRPVVTERGIMFSIRPASGTVEPYRELDCEVLWHPSFSSPAVGDFDLCVHEGNTERLHCIAKIGCTSVELTEKQITFESVPLNLTSIRTAVLYNSGQKHAYYQVLDVCPLPGLVVSPSEGVVPSGGQTSLKIHLIPESVIKFDTRVEIALRNMKSIELRVSGSVEHPHVDISLSHFQFYGVYAGSRRVIPFTLINRSSSTAQVTINLSEYPEFCFQFPQNSAKEPGVSTVEMQGYQTVACSLIFSPTQEATCDFDLPLMVNGLPWSTSSSSLLPVSSSSTSSHLSGGSTKQTVKLLLHSMTAQQSLRIQATALCAPLELSPSSLEFQVEPLAPQSHIYTKTVELKAVFEEAICLYGVISEHVHWWFDCNVIGQIQDSGEEALCTVSPSCGSLGPDQSISLTVSIRPEAVRTVNTRLTRLSLPLYLGDETGKGMGEDEGLQPYRELSISITLQLPSITIHPHQILFTPVPLKNSATCTLIMTAVGYPSGTKISAKVDDVELEDGTKIQPVSVNFPEGNFIPVQTQDQRHPVGFHCQEARVTSLMCSVSFCSIIPLSFCTTITFTDHVHNKFEVKLYATAENCLLTAWPYLALHRTGQQIVLKTGATAVETDLLPYNTPSPASGLASSSSSFDHSSSTNKNSALDSFPDSDSVTRQTYRNEEVSPNRGTPTCHSVPVFPNANSDEGLYHQNVLLAVEKWFSLFGWPSGPHPISIPHTLRRVMSKVQKNSSGRTYRVSQNKDSRSVVEMLHHLTGTQIPGVPYCQTFSSDIDQRTNQLLQQNKALLAFLRVQGSFLSHIRPEYLLDVKEFKHWCSLQSNEKGHGLVYRSVEYESLSKRSWTDLLLQIYKVLVLRRMSENSPQNTFLNQKEAAKTLLDSQPLASNIYSASELHLLSWLNMHYESMRETIWGPGVPSARWIVNFDLDLTDGLVLGALVAAFCPYLIYSHFRRMYTTTSSLEQILHNNIIVVQALTVLSLNINVQPTDLSDPNPVQMLMLCVHLYERLPQYLPEHTITLSGGLHSTFTKQVRLKNPSSKPVKYQVLLLGRDAHLFSLPDGSAVNIPPKGRTEFIVQYSCSFLQPKEAVMLLTSSAFGLHSSALAFNLKTCVSHITPSNSVKCTSPCYQLRVIQLPVTNPFNEEAKFRVVLVESTFNPLGPEKETDSLVQQASSKAKTAKTTSEWSRGDDVEGKFSALNGDDSEFLSPVRIVCLKSGQADTLNIHYLPFWPGTKYCSVLLVCPQVGDMVCILTGTAELPLPSPLTARPSSNIVPTPSDSDSPVCVSALSLCCKVEQVCEEVLRVPLINMAREQALVVWGQHSMSACEHMRRMLTKTLHSSTIRATVAGRKFYKQAMRSAEQSKVIEYNVDVSLPQYFTLPSTVKIPIEEDISIPWENPTECGCVDIPLRFQADSVGKFTCQVVLRSWCDTRVFILQALVTPQTIFTYLDFSAPIFHSVTRDIPLHNETKQDWNLQAELSGKGFCGPKDLNVAAGTRACYPLTFHPSSWGTVLGKLTLYNKCHSTEHVFALRGVGELPLPVNHVVVQCTVGKTTHTQLDVPNYSKKKLTLTAATDLSIVSGSLSLEIKPGQSASYVLALTPQKRGRYTGRVSFIGTTDIEDTDRDMRSILGHYEVYFTLDIICEPAAPVKFVDVQCVAQRSVTIEIPVTNPEGELLMLNVYLEGDNLSGASLISVPPWETLTYKATFSPDRVGKSTGSVIFQSELVGEVWYQLDLYALPPPVVTLPQACCQLGKWVRLSIPLVNPEADCLQLIVTNSNPRNYTLEMDSGSPLTLEPHSSTQLIVCFRPSAIGEGNHTAKVTFTCPQSQDWCVLLRGLGLNPEIEESLSISSVIGSSASVTIPFTNPTELPAMLKITLTDEDPATPECHPGTTDKDVFFIPLSHTEGIKLNEGASFDVPVVFAPKSMELQQTWLRITMKPLGCPDSNFSANAVGLDQEGPGVCWIYPLRGIPMKMLVKNSAQDVIKCEAGCQLEKKMEVLLSGCVLANQDQEVEEISQVPIEGFLCKVHANSEAERSKVEDSLSATVESARRDPETGIITVILNLFYTPLQPHRHSVVLAVQYLSSRTWEFPLDLNATEPLVDDVITIKAVEIGKTTAVGFRLTSTTRKPKPFTAAFMPGSSSEFTVSPMSGMLPAVGSRGALITVSFTPIASCKRHRARLSVQAANAQWTYEVRGQTPEDSPSPVGGSSFTSSY